MADLNKIVSPTILDLIEAFSDFTGFAQLNRTKTKEELFEFMSEYYEFAGDTLNITASLKSNGFSMTPQLFRKLKGNTRKHFKKHTPPVTYIPIEERHKDK